jgi:hypothetical protein
MSGFEIVMSILTAIYVGATVIYVRISKNTLHAIRKQGEENLKHGAQARVPSKSACATARGRSPKEQRSRSLGLRTDLPTNERPHGSAGLGMATSRGKDCRFWAAG